jgi:MFS family permease
MPDVDRDVLTLALARMADAIGNSFLIVVLPLYVASTEITGGAFGVSEALVTGLILSMYGFFSSFLQPFTGRLSDRRGARRIFILLGLGILTVANGAYVFADGYVALLGIRALQGIGVAFTLPATIALVNELATTDTRGGSMGTYNTFRLLGFGVGPIVAGAVVHSGPYAIGLGGLAVGLDGFDAAFAIATLAAIVGFALVTVFIEDPERTHASAGEDLSVAVWARDDAHRLDPVFTLGVASLFMAVAIALLSAIEPQVNTRLDQGPTLFGLEFGAFILAQVGLQTPIGAASDRYGRRPFLLAGLALLVPTTLAQGLVTTPAGMLVARVLQGVAAAMVFSPALALAGDLADEGQSGTQLSVLTMAFGLGIAIGPLASGFLVGFGFVYPFAFGAGLALIGLVLVYTEVVETVGAGASDSSRETVAPQD